MAQLRVCSLLHHIQICKSAVFGWFQRGDQPGKWHLILDLSSPDGHSVNCGIPKTSRSVQCITIDSFIGIMTQGHGTLMAKVDVASAYLPTQLYLSFGSPTVGYEVMEKILCGHGSAVWSLVCPIQLHCYCRGVQWLHTYGVFNGPLGGLSSCATISQWSLFCLLVPVKYM